MTFLSLLKHFWKVRHLFEHFSSSSLQMSLYLIYGWFHYLNHLFHTFTFRSSVLFLYACLQDLALLFIWILLGALWASQIYFIVSHYFWKVLTHYLFTYFQFLFSHSRILLKMLGHLVLSHTSWMFYSVFYSILVSLFVLFWLYKLVFKLIDSFLDCV